MSVTDQIQMIANKTEPEIRVRNSSSRSMIRNDIPSKPSLAIGSCYVILCHNSSQLHWLLTRCVLGPRHLGSKGSQLHGGA
jgi:hypothetical protein